MTASADRHYILLVVPSSLISGQPLAAELSLAPNLDVARARALDLIGADAGIGRVVVLDAHTGQVMGLVTRQAPHWELPMTLAHASLAVH